MFSNKIFIFIILIFVALGFQNCGPKKSNDGLIPTDSNSTSRIEKANFEWINSNIIQPKCLECHNESLAFGGLLMTNYNEVMKSVVPGEPSNSSFYTRSFSTIFFELNSEEQEIIRLWILDGAQ